MSAVGTCPNGHINPPDQGFCGACGARVTMVSALPPAPGAEEPSAATPVERMGRRQAAFIVVVSAAIVLVGLTAFVLFREGGTDTIPNLPAAVAAPPKVFGLSPPVQRNTGTWNLSAPSNPAAVGQLHAFYNSAMPELGWHLYKDFPPEEFGSTGVSFGGAYWANGKQGASVGINDDGSSLSIVITVCPPASFDSCTS